MLPDVTGNYDMMELLERASLGEADAITVLYEVYGNMVSRTGLRVMQSESEAEDVLQDVFLGLPRALKTYEGRGSFEGWLKRVVTRTALLKLRARRRKSEVSIESVQLSFAMDTRDRPIDRVLLETAIAALPERLRTVFVLKEMMGYSHADIGQLLGIAPNAARARLHRARKRLRKLLEGSR
jgi:RNA polymerase sigma-70 factor (ECF subfamily)